MAIAPLRTIFVVVCAMGATGCAHYPAQGNLGAMNAAQRVVRAASVRVGRHVRVYSKERQHAELRGRRLNQVETVARNNADKPPSPPEGDADLLVAILMARPEITSISDLAGKGVAIDEKYSASNGNVRIAIVAAGAPEVQLRENRTAAIDRLVSGDVPAAVLALTSARAADGFPEISGYKIFHIPLSPRSAEGPASDGTVGIARQ
jgi:hypothetical protein